jgi:hypothetical protein
MGRVFEPNVFEFIDSHAKAASLVFEYLIYATPLLVPSLSFNILKYDVVEKSNERLN